MLVVDQMEDMMVVLRFKKDEVFAMVALNLCKYLFRLKDMAEAIMLLSREHEVRGDCGDDVVGYCEVHQEDEEL